MTLQLSKYHHKISGNVKLATGFQVLKNLEVKIDMFCETTSGQNIRHGINFSQQQQQEKEQEQKQLLPSLDLPSYWQR